jgi:hypothetical protein
MTMRDYDQFCEDHGELNEYEIKAAAELEDSKQADRETKKPESFYTGVLPW